jgi:diguanylate cyclase (GGDEF)-like protein/PAS domain S-box-containing protein
LKSKHVGLRLGVAFAVLIAILAGIGQLGLRRMHQINDILSDITGRRLEKLQLAQEALALSNRNSRITMAITLVEHRALIDTLSATRSENSKEITRLIEESERHCESEKEKQLLSAVKTTRKPYVESYLRAIHLLVDEGKHDEAEAVMVNETLPALLKYHAAWDEFVDLQKRQLDMAAKQAKVDYSKARRLSSLLSLLAVAVAFGIAVVTTRHAEKSAQRSEIQYQLLFDSNPLPMWVFDRKTLKFLEVNEAASRQYGFSSREFLAMTIADIRPEGDIPRLLKTTAKSVHGLQEATIWRHRRKDGAIIDVEVVGHDLDFHGIEAELIAARDVTERKKTEEMVQRLASIVEFSEDAIIGKNLDGVITSWNRAAEKMYEYTSTEVIGRELSFLLPSERQAEMRVIMERLRSGQPIACLETKRLTKTGSILDVSLSISPLKDATGRIIGASAIARDITLRKRSEEQLKLQSGALEAAANAIVITDFHGTIQWVNQAFTTMTGFSKEEVVGKNPRLLKSGKQQRSYYADLWSTVSSGKVWHGELINRRKDGTTYIEEMTITPIAQNVGQANWTHFIAIKQDITARKQAEKELRLAQFSVEHASDSIFLSNSQGHFVYVNKAACDSLGYSREELLCLSVPDLNPRFPKEEEWPTFWEELKRQGSITFEGRNIGKKGRVFPAEVTANYLEFDGQEYSFAFVRNITERKVAEERIKSLAYNDALTGLPNRTLLRDRLAKALAGARRQKGKVALLFLDLDRFKDINDLLGHSVGDLLLQEVAERLKRFARDQDTVARLGGDEFLIMLTHVKDVSDAAVAAERLMDAMTHEFVIQGHSLHVSCSVGISIFPEHGADAETLIKDADAAMYSAKENGRNNFRFFTEEMNAQVMERLTLESSLRRALPEKELFLMYQPQMDIATGKIIGLEALLRWQHPDLGLVPPDKFIRVAENSGLILPIGEWVLRTACSQARKWQEEGLPAVTVAVNVSAVQFRQEDFCELIRRALNETGLGPQYLELELTEGLLLANADVTLSVLKELKSMGVTLAIDDFGTGYSSFSYLRQFRVSKLKIDRSFIRDVAVKPDDAAITTAIISMARSLNLKVIAEGVENEAQMTFLRAHQCDEIQGYYFSKPLEVGKVADMLRDHSPEPQARAQASGTQS